MSSKVTVPFCIPTGSEWEFLLLHIFVRIWCCQCFGFWPNGYVMVSHCCWFFFLNYFIIIIIFNSNLLFIYLFLYIYFWLCWVFVSVRGLSPAAASGGHSSSRCAGLSLSRPLLLRSTGSRRAGSVVVAHGPSCPAARGILPDQGSNPCPLH